MLPILFQSQPLGRCVSAHSLRSHLIRSSALQAQPTTHLRAALALYRSNSSFAKPPPPPNDSHPLKAPEAPSIDAQGATSLKFKLPQAEPRLSITFTCTVPDCNTRSTHEFSKRSYEKGIVLVECPGCKNRHLIADHLGWFKDGTEDGKFKTIEDLMRSKGELVRRGKVDSTGDIEYAPDEP